MALFVLKSVHSLIFIVESIAILYIVYSGLFDIQDNWLVVAIVLVLLEVAVFVGNGTRCPMTRFAQQLGDATGDDYIADLFLPRWLSQHIPYICGSLALIGFLLVGFRVLI